MPKRAPDRRVRCRRPMPELAILPSRLVDPLFLVLVAAAIGLWFVARPALSHGRARARRGAWVLCGAWLSLWIAATPYVAIQAVRAVEPPPADLRVALAGIDPSEVALVVLGGGMRPNDFGTPPMERLHGGSVIRTVGAARIWKEHGFGRVVVSGYAGTEGQNDLAQGMSDLLVALGVPKERIEVEPDSINTRQNAERSMALLRAGTPPRKVVVVTTAMHLPRALAEFRRAGVEAVGAPVDHEGFSRATFDMFIPSSSALWHTHRVLHELLGRLKP